MSEHGAVRTFEEQQDTLARNLVAARTVLGISQEQLAARAGISRATVNQLEGGASANGDPRMSTVVSLAAALRIPPMFLMLGRAELDAITGIARSAVPQHVQSQLTASQLETMRRLLRSGVAKNRSTAVEMGKTAVDNAGVHAASAAVASAIGTALLPGLGTAIGAALGTLWLAQRASRDDSRE